MSRHIRIYSGSDGLSTKLDPTRIEFDPRTGVSSLAACVNCAIDDSGRIVRRDGFVATDRIEAWHSLFSCEAYALGVTGNALAVIESDMSYTALRNVQVGARMSWVRDTDGERDVIYYCNGYQAGRIIDKISHSWPVSEYVGPETRKTFSQAPVGHLLCIRNGRMFIGQDNILWYSEPGAMSLFRLAANYFVFSSRLKMLQAVDGGLWISDSESVYFLGGNIAPEIQEMPLQTLKTACPVIEGSAVKVPGNRIAGGEMQGEAVAFTTTAGICIGAGDGTLLSITERKIDLPYGNSGAGLYIDGHYICIID
jgi:hypothetical protein